MARPSLMRRAGVHLSWIVACAALFAAFSGAEDPARPRDRVSSNEAAARAAAILHQDARYRGFEVVHVASAGRGEGGPEPRWVVLLDRVPRTGLRDAVVVELRTRDGALLGIRAPVR